MTIQVNGNETEIAPGTTVADLLAQMGIPTAGTAIARNDAVVRRAEHATTVLEPADRIEIIRAVAGG